MSSKRLDKISDYARHGYAAKAECRECGNSAKLDAQALSDDAVTSDASPANLFLRAKNHNMTNPAATSQTELSILNSSQSFRFRR